MEFLVSSELRLPSDLPEPRRAELLAQEVERGTELKRRGAIVRIWRVPGRREGVAIWEAADATELHDLLMSLPLSPWVHFTVTALARHYLEEPGGA